MMGCILPRITGASSLFPSAPNLPMFPSFSMGFQTFAHATKALGRGTTPLCAPDYQNTHLSFAIAAWPENWLDNLASRRWPQHDVSLLALHPAVQSNSCPPLPSHASHTLAQTNPTNMEMCHGGHACTATHDQTVLHRLASTQHVSTCALACIHVLTWP